MSIIELEKVIIPPIGVHLVFNVYLNELETKVVLDTGASRSVFDSNFLKEYLDGIVLKEESSDSAGVGGANLASYTTVLESVKLGNETLNKVELAVMDLSHVRQSYLSIDEEEIFGVIGGDLLDHFQAIIDYKTSTLMLNN